MEQPCDLSEKHCMPCKGGIPALKGEHLSALLGQLAAEWQIVKEHHLEKKYLFPDFKSALAFTNQVGAIAEQEGHHPDIYLSYGSVVIKIWTHKVDGLTESDFVLAAKCDKL